MTEYFAVVPGDKRYTYYPISPQRQKYKDLLEKMRDANWRVADVRDLHLDRAHYETRLTPSERKPVDYILAFFAAGDAIVNINLRDRFRAEIPIPEVTHCYDCIGDRENIHAETYSLLLESIYHDPSQREELITACENIPVIKIMTDYMFNCIKSEEPLPLRLLRMACVEGLFFQGCFCIIYWFQSRGLMPGLSTSNVWIANDERDHTTLSLMLFQDVKPEYRPSNEEIYRIIRESVAITKEFTRDAIPAGNAEVNADAMNLYIEMIADNLLALIGVPALYKSKHQFGFMSMIDFPTTTNFFERVTTEYVDGLKEANDFDTVVDV